jgi:hypothetical protein
MPGLATSRSSRHARAKDIARLATPGSRHRARDIGLATSGSRHPGLATPRARDRAIARLAARDVPGRDIARLATSAQTSRGS